MEKKRIIVYVTGEDAINYYRLILPYGTLASKSENFDVRFRSAFTPDDLIKTDLVVFQRVDKASGAAYFNLARSRGVRVIMDLDDDLWGVPEWNPAYNFVMQPQVRAGCDGAIEAADVITVSTERLRSVVLNRHPGAKVVVVPNSVHLPSIPQRRRNNRTPVVGWAGGDTHEKDMDVMRPVLDRFYDSGNIVRLFCSRYKDCEIIPHVPFPCYYPTLALLDMDVAFAPLLDIPFNCSKSNLRFLEYAAVGSPVVASNVEPYRKTIRHGETGLLVENSQEMCEAARYLIESPHTSKSMAERARKLLEEEYSIDVTWRKWEEVVKSVLS